MVVTDIASRAQAEGEMGGKEARFRNLADQAPVILWTTDASGGCTQLSQRWFEVTGQTPAAGRGAGWLEAIHPEDRGPFGETFRAAAQRIGAAPPRRVLSRTSSNPWTSRKSGGCWSRWRQTKNDALDQHFLRLI